jgi:hypothetical protein
VLLVYPCREVWSKSRTPRCLLGTNAADYHLMDHGHNCQPVVLQDHDRAALMD